MTEEERREEGTELLLDFQKLAGVAAIGGLLPCAVQNVDTGLENLDP